MKNTENIEKLFKETFEHFEADVNPQVWANVQSGINSGVGNVVSTAAKFAIGKTIAGVASVALIAGSVWYFSSSDNKTISSSEKQNQTEPASKDISKNTISENQSAENIFTAKTQRRKDFSNQNSYAHSQQTQIVSGSNDTATVPSSSENTLGASSQSEHKYGNGSDAPTSLIRGNQIQNSKSKPSKDNSSYDDQNVDHPPTATIFASTQSGDAPLTVTFSNQGIASAVSWDFGDGAASRENFPSHIFDKPGTYIVTLNAKNSSGNVSDKITIEVRQISDITNPPNIFTPNGDGKNDVFFCEMKNINSIGVAIYSQKECELVYQWNSLDGNWNGKKMNGNDAPQGVYLYSIQAIGIDGIVHHKKGTVTLRRIPE
ncbi:MAG: PKD domain-containing protein [Bacteroidota bacterium]